MVSAQQLHQQSVLGGAAVESPWDDERFLTLLQDPIGDPRLDDIPDTTRNQVSQIANALLAKHIEPTVRRVAAVARELELLLPEPDLLAGLLMEIWWIRFNEIIPDDVEALQIHLKGAPAPDHPCCRFLQGLIHELTTHPPL